MTVFHKCSSAGGPQPSKTRPVREWVAASVSSLSSANNPHRGSFYCGKSQACAKYRGSPIPMPLPTPPLLIFIIQTFFLSLYFSLKWIWHDGKFGKVEKNCSLDQLLTPQPPFITVCVMQPLCLHFPCSVYFKVAKYSCSSFSALLLFFFFFVPKVILRAFILRSATCINHHFNGYLMLHGESAITKLIFFPQVIWAPTHFAVMNNPKMNSHDTTFPAF